MRYLVIAMTVWAACGPKPEARTVAAAAPPSQLEKRLELDAARLGHGGGAGSPVAVLVERHLQTVGLVQPGPAAGAPRNGGGAGGAVSGERVRLRALLPTPGYVLEAEITPRPEDFCTVKLSALTVDGGAARPVDKAPFWVQDALAKVAAGVTSLEPPRAAPLDDVAFARLHGQAAALGRAGRDPPLTVDEYIHAPRPLGHAPFDYWSPPPDEGTLRAPIR